jgi:phytoene synthase
MAHAAGFLRANDPDRYFASLVLPEEHRPAIQALWAFGADVASIRDRVSQPAPGEIRLQWWADALQNIAHGEVHQNPLAAELLDAIARYRLPTGALLRLIAARRFDLYDDKMPDVATFEGYAGETASVLFQLAAVILNDGQPVETGDAAGHLGVAQALVGHLAAFGYNASKGRLFLPWSVFAANGVHEQEIFEGRVSEGLLAALAQLHDLAREHRAKADIAIAGLPRTLRPAFAMIALLPSRLSALERGQESPYSPPRELPDWRKIAALWWWSATRS